MNQLLQNRKLRESLHLNFQSLLLKFVLLSAVVWWGSVSVGWGQQCPNPTSTTLIYQSEDPVVNPTIGVPWSLTYQLKNTGSCNAVDYSLKIYSATKDGNSITFNPNTSNPFPKFTINAGATGNASINFNFSDVGFYRFEFDLVHTSGTTVPALATRLFVEVAVQPSTSTITAPTPTSPSNNQVLPTGTSSTTFSWNKNNTGATYQLIVYNISSSATVYDQNIGDVSTKNVSGLIDGDNYRWVVIANKGADSETSGTFFFSVDNTSSPPPSNLSLAPSAWSAPSSNETREITVTSTGAWTVSDDQSWILLSTSSGGPDGSFEITVQENINPSLRTGTVTVDMGGTIKTVTVNQGAGAAADFLTVTPTPGAGIEINAGSNGGNETINISSNVSWTVSSSDNSWMPISSTSGTDNGSITIDVKPNTGTTQRSGTVTISGGGFTETIDIEQDGSTPSFSTSTNSLNVGSGEGCETVDYTTNTDANFNSTQSWAIPNQTLVNAGSGSFDVCFLANNGTDSRDGVLQIDGDGISEIITYSQDGAPCKNVGGLVLCADSYTATQANGNVRFNDILYLGSIVNYDPFSITTQTSTGILSVRNIKNLGTVNIYSSPISHQINVNGDKLTAPEFGLTNSLLKLAGLKAGIDEIEVLGEDTPNDNNDDGVKINGKIAFPIKLSSLGSKTQLTPELSDLSYTKGKGRQFSGKIKLENLSLFNQLEIKEFEIGYEGLENKFVGKADIKIPILATRYTVDAEMLDGTFNKIGVDINNCGAGVGMPLYAGLSLKGGGIELDNIATADKWWQTKLTLHGNVAPHIFDICSDTYLKYGLKGTISGSLELGENWEAKLEGEAELFKQKLASVYFKLKRQQVDLGGEVNYFGLIEGEARVGYSDVGFNGSFGLTAKIPTEEEFSKWNKYASFLAKGYFLTKGYGTGDVFGSSYNYVTTQYLVGHARTTTDKKNIRIYYSLVWKDGNPEINIGKKFKVIKSVNKEKDLHDIPAEEYQRLRISFLEPQYQKSIWDELDMYSLTASNNEVWSPMSTETSVYDLEKSTSTLAIFASNSSGTPQINITLPNEQVVNEFNVDSFSEVSLVKDGNEVAFIVENPQLGYYIVEHDANDEIELQQDNIVPEIELTNVTHNASANTISIDWLDSDPDNDAKISLYIDSDDKDYNGRQIVENLSEDENSNSYVWNYSDLKTGTYYIHATIIDDEYQFTTDYFSKPINVVHDKGLSPPKNLSISHNDSEVTLTWDVDDPATQRFTIYYSDVLNTVNFNSKAYTVLGDNEFVYPFKPGRYYEFMITSLDEDYVEGTPSEIISIDFTSGTLNNYPFINKSKNTDIGYVNTPYQYQTSVDDKDNDPLTYQLVESPTGMTISNSGLIQWTPSTLQRAYHKVKVMVEDDKAAKDSLEFTINVLDEDDKRAFIKFNKPLYIDFDDTGIIEVEDLDFDGDVNAIDKLSVNVSSESDPSGVTIELIETDKSSNRYKGNFKLVSSSSSSKSLNVSGGDKIFVKYDDNSISDEVSTHAYFIEFEADFYLEETTFCAGDSVVFINTSKGSELVYNWDFGNGNTSQEKHPKIAYEASEGVTTYDVTLNISDPDGRIDTYTETITVSNPKATFEKVDITCFGEDDGQIEFTADGGIEPYTYEWSNEATTEKIVNLSPGFYTLTLTDAIGCTFVDSVEIKEPDSLYIASQVIPVTCQGANDARIKHTTIGGTAPYTYEWYKDEVLMEEWITEDLDSLTSGVYSVIVTDANECITTKTVLVSEPDLLVLTPTVKNTTCENAEDGMIAIAVEGGLPFRDENGNPYYKFDWNTGATDSVITNLKANTIEPYEVLVLDSAGCYKSFKTDITEPTGIPTFTYNKEAYCQNEVNPTPTVSALNNGVYSASSTDLIIDEETGEIDLKKSVAGTYTISYITSINSCNPTPQEITITPLPSAEFEYERKKFIQSELVISPTIMGETGGDFSVNDNGLVLDAVTGEVSLNGSTPGTYIITYTTPTCAVSSTFEIEILKRIHTKTDITCFGENDGEAEIILDNGLAPFTYQWSHGPTARKVTNLSAGKYIFSVTDSLGNVLTDSLIIEEPEQLFVQFKTVPVSCNEAENGKINLIPNGGTAPYIYEWYKDGTLMPNATTEDLEGLSSGVYEVIVTDSRGCIENKTILLTEPDLLLIEPTVKNVTCQGASDGMIAVAVKGGIPFRDANGNAYYKFEWNTGQTDSVIVNLSGNTVESFEVLVLDSAGCSATFKTDIEEPEGVPTFSYAQELYCQNEANPTPSRTANNGTFSASSTDLVIDEMTGEIDLEVSQVGTYTITYSSLLAACEPDPQTVEIIAPPSAAFSYAEIKYRQSEGNVSPSLTGAAGGVFTADSENLRLDEETGEINLAASEKGKYEIIYTTPEPCLQTATFALEVFGATDISQSDTTVCPGTTLTLKGAEGAGAYEWKVDGTTVGTENELTYDFNTSGARTVSLTTTLSGRPPVTDEVNIIVRETESAAFAYPESFVCGSMATTTPNVSGTKGGTFITLSAGIVIDKATGKVDVTASEAGEYQIEYTTPFCGAKDTTTLTIYKIGVELEVRNIRCYGEQDGFAKITVTGSTAYSQVWSNGLEGENIDNLTKGEYSVTVTDSLTGCQETLVFTIEEPQPLLVELVPTSVSVAGLADGRINAIVQGGTQPYTYEWSSGETTEDLEGISGGVYTLTVTDANGICKEVAVTFVEEPDELGVAGTVSNITCQGLANGNISIHIGGGKAPYQVFWDNGATTTELSDLAPGDYKVTVLDEEGATVEETYTVSEPEGEPTFSYERETYCLGNGSALPSIANINNGTFKADKEGIVLDEETGEISLLTSKAGTYIISYISDIEACNPPAQTVTLLPNTVAISYPTSIFQYPTGTISPTIEGAVGGTFSSQEGLAIDANTGIINADESQAGTYTVDYLSPECQIPASFTLSISKMEVELTVTQIDCSGADNGSILIEASNGIEPYLYRSSDGRAIDSLTNLKPGTYQIEVIDSILTTKTFEVVITEPTPMELTIAIDSVSCFGGTDGRADLSIDGNYVLPLTFEWTNAEGTVVGTKEDLRNVSFGTYNLLVTDAKGCAAETRAFIGQPDSLEINLISQENSTCEGANNGSLEISTSGGTGKHDILWRDNGSKELVRTSLAPGTYTVDVWDANICKASLTIEITEPIGTPSFAYDTTLYCVGEPNILPVIRNLSGGAFTTDNSSLVLNKETGEIDLQNTPPGIYKVQLLTGVNSCNPEPLTLTIQSRDASFVYEQIQICHDAASFLPTVIGVQGGKFTSTEGVSLNEQTGLIVPSESTPGIYTVTYTIPKCEEKTEVEIEILPQSILTLQNTSPTICLGEITELQFTYEGSSYPYSFQYTDGAVVYTESNITDSVVNLTVSPSATTTYELVSVTYGNGCEGKVQGSNLVAVNPLPTLREVTTTPDFCNNSDGAIFIELEGQEGTAPFLYSLNGGDFVADSLLVDLEAGFYTLSVLDSNGCIYDYPTEIEIETAECKIVVPNRITPNGDGLNDVWEIQGLEKYPKATVHIINRWGGQVVNTDLGIGSLPWNGAGSEGKDPVRGTYFYIINLGDGSAPIRGYITVIK